MSIAKQEFTNAGRSMLGRAQNTEVLRLTKIVVGSGTATQPSDLWPLTALKQYVMDVTISARRDFGNGVLLVEGSFKSVDAPAAFDLREVGIMAHIGAEADRLYSVANVFTDPPDHIDPAAPTIQVFKVKLIVDRIPTGQLVIDIGPTEAVMGENTLDDAVGPGVYKETLGNVLRFKRLEAGTRIEMIEDANEDKITIGVKTVNQNLDFYVPLTYPGITDPATLFPTIQAALDSVADVIIPANRSVTVHVYSGHFAQTTPVLITHPNGTQINIVGVDVVQLAVTGTITVAVAGAAPNYTVSVTVPSLAGIAVGDVVQIFNAPSGLLETGGYVVATRPTPTPTVDIRIRSNVAPTSIAAAGNTKLILYPSQITTNVPAGINVFQTKYGIGLIKNFGIRNLQAARVGVGIVLEGVGTLEKIAALGFSIGFGVRNGSLTLNPSALCTQCNVGVQIAPYAGCIVGPPSADGINRIVFSGNDVHGIWITSGNWQSSSNTYTFANANISDGVRNDNGYFVNGNAPATTGGLVCAWNDVGLAAAIIGITFTTLNATNTVALNVTWDCQASGGGQIHVAHNVNTSGRYSPANGVLGPDGGFVSVQTP
jgi:hypothetical protein